MLAACNLTVRDTALPDPATVVLAAQTRRAQLIVEQEQLERLLRRTVAIDARAVIQSSINRHRFEIEQLNKLINE